MELAQLRRAQRILFPEYWQVGALVFSLRADIFPSHASYHLGHNKIEMTRAISALDPGYLPETHILANTRHNAEQLWDAMSLPFVAKLPRSAEGRGVWLIEEGRDWRAYQAATDVLYVQEYLPIDRDIRVVIVGDDVIAAYWRLQSPDGFHNNLARGGLLDTNPVPPAAVELARLVSASLGIDHAGFDIAMVGERPYILEFNRLFGTAGIPGGMATVNASILKYLMRDIPGEPGRTPPQLPRAA